MPRPRASQTPRHARPSRLPIALERLDSKLGDRAVRLVGTAVAGLVLLTAGAASGVSASTASTAAVIRPAALTQVKEVLPQPVALPPLATRKPAAKPARAAKKAAVRRPAVKAAARTPRWLPSGTGMWLHEFKKSEGGDARAVVARAQRSGLSHVFVQTGSSKKGWIGTPVLKALLPATKGTGIRVIAWDFPTLQNPRADALRMVRAARYRCVGCPIVAAVAPDVETAAEGTKISASTVRTYYIILRQNLPSYVAILATVPWPSEKRTARYPYAMTAAFADALVPMAYWYNRSPMEVTGTSMRWLKRFHKPIMPVGQGYDARLDAPYLPRDPRPGSSVLAFLRTAKAGGAQAVSLWSWQTTGRQQWIALKRGHAMFPG
ncbi:MAG: hypothetical protein JWM40_2198 [Frankiales bacterium]|nr:hypothetical protein [Frankiales bacterium]